MFTKLLIDNYEFFRKLITQLFAFEKDLITKVHIVHRVTTDTGHGVDILLSVSQRFELLSNGFTIMCPCIIHTIRVCD